MLGARPPKPARARGKRDDAAAIERLIRRTTSDDAGYDRDVLADIDRLAWSQP